MNIVGNAERSLRPRLDKQILVSLLVVALLFATWPQNLSAYPDACFQRNRPRLPLYPARRSRRTRNRLRPVAAVGSTDCIVSGFTCRTDPGRVDLSGANRRGR